MNTKVTRPLTKNKTEEELLAFVTEQLIQRAPIYEQTHLTVKEKDFDLLEISRMPIIYVSNHTFIFSYNCFDQIIIYLCRQYYESIKINPITKIM